MLQTRHLYPIDEQMMMIINGWVAWDKEAGIHMYESRGRRMTGRPTRYIVSKDKRDDGTLVWGHIKLTALSLAEAIEKATKRIERGDLEAAVAKEAR